MSAQVAADLRAAADVLRRDGWRQGDVGSLDGPKCLAGAINYVASGGRSVDDFDEDEDAEIRADDACRAVAGLVGENYVYLTRWNDAEGRTEAEVLAALEAAAEAEQ